MVTSSQIVFVLWLFWVAAIRLYICVLFDLFFNICVLLSTRLSLSLYPVVNHRSHLCLRSSICIASSFYKSWREESNDIVKGQRVQLIEKHTILLRHVKVEGILHIKLDLCFSPALIYVTMLMPQFLWQVEGLKVYTVWLPLSRLPYILSFLISVNDPLPQHLLSLTPFHKSHWVTGVTFLTQTWRRDIRRP